MDDKRRRILVVLCGVTISVCSVLLYVHDLRMANREAEGAVRVGHGQSINGDARRRPQRRLLWSEFVDADAIFDGDTVKTGSDSGAELIFVDGTRVTLGPDSLIVVERPQEGLRVSVASGEIFVSGRAVIRVGNRQARVSGGEAALKVETGAEGFSLEAKSGVVEVEREESDAFVPVSIGRELVASPASIVERRPEFSIKPFPLTPAPGTRLVAGTGTKLRFRWVFDPSAEKKEDGHYRIELVDQSGRTVASFQADSEQRLEAELPEPGHYQWRIRRVWREGGEGPWSEDIAFEVRPPPKLSAPRL